MRCSRLLTSVVRPRHCTLQSGSHPSPWETQPLLTFDTTDESSPPTRPHFSHTKGRKALQLCPKYPVNPIRPFESQSTSNDLSTHHMILVIASVLR